jgi:hypothetical protein
VPDDEMKDVTTEPPEPVERVEAASTSRFAAIRGVFRGQVHMADDFDELPDDIADAFDAR